MTHANQIQQHAERHSNFRIRHCAIMDVPNGRIQTLLESLSRELFEFSQIVVDVLRYHVEIETLRALRFLVHEEGERLLRRIRQPLFYSNAVSLRFGDLLGLLIEEHFIRQIVWRRSTQNAANLTR